MGFCCKAVLLGIGFLAGSGLMTASSFSLSASASVSGPQGAVICPATGPASAGCAESYSIPFGQGSIDYGGTAAAAASFGELHAGATAFGGCPGVEGPYNCFDQRGGALSQATAAFADYFTLGGAPSKGYLDLTVVAEGTISETCGGYDPGAICNGSLILRPFLTVGDNGANGQILINGAVTAGALLGDGQTVLNVLVPYNTAQQTPAISLSLSVADDCGTADESTCATSVNFLDTAYVSGLSVLDSNGNAVNSASITSASGTDYNAINVLVAPEPSTWFLLISGACLTIPLTLRSRRRRC